MLEKIKKIFNIKHSYLNNYVDELLLYSTLLLMIISLLFVYSASISYINNNQCYYLIRHAGYILFGILLGFIIFSAPTSMLQKYANILLIICGVLLVLVLVPHISKVTNGARRWLQIGSIHIQPSEIAKLAVTLYLAKYASEHNLHISSRLGLLTFYKNIFPALLCVVSIVLLILIEPDMGSTAVIFIIAFSILFLADIDKKIIFSTLGIGCVAFILLILDKPYRMKRVLAFVNPWQDALGNGYQLTHSLLAYGHGGFIGVGLGNSIEKLSYLPEAHTDFILAIIAEEIGVIGVLFIITLYLIIFYRGFMVIGNQALLCRKSRFQSYLARGISIWFIAQAFINIGVTVGLLPTKGLTLPFISYGGSSIIVSCVAMAILLKIDYENKAFLRGLVVT